MTQIIGDPCDTGFGGDDRHLVSADSLQGERSTVGADQGVCRRRRRMLALLIENLVQR